MYYEINVSHRVSGKQTHYFATAPRSITDRRSAMQAFKDFKRRFPESEGFKVTISQWESTGTDKTFNFNEAIKVGA